MFFEFYGFCFTLKNVVGSVQRSVIKIVTTLGFEDIDMLGCCITIELFHPVTHPSIQKLFVNYVNLIQFWNFHPREFL